jgi:prevent-host-death family protein
MLRIGVRELRQHASRYLARVEAGESVEVTDRGRLVARLVPAGVDPWDDLVAAGQVTLPATDADLLDVVPATLPPGVATPSAVLAALRAEER